MLIFILFAGLQVVLARFSKAFLGIILPCVWLVLYAENMWNALTSSVRLRPDFWLFMVYVFPVVFLPMLFLRFIIFGSANVFPQI